MANGKAILTRGGQFLALLVLGCSADVGTVDEQSRALQTLDHDAIVMTYHEGSSRLDIVVNLDQFVDPAQVEMQVEVTIPDGTTTRHDLRWNPAENPELPRIEMPAIDNGVYEVALTNLSMEGRSVGGPIVHQHMELLGVRSRGELLAECGPGEVIEGTVGPDVLEGTAGQDTIYAYAGDDSVSGKECSDILHGGKGDDQLWGNEGNDVLIGGEGNDVCTGGPGLDTFGGCEIAIQD